MNNRAIRILYHTVIAILCLIGLATSPVLYKYYTYKPVEIETDWQITLYSPNGDEYQTWYHHGKKPSVTYGESGGRVYDPAKMGFHILECDGEKVQAPIGWYLDIKTGKEDESLKLTQNHE